jgi:transglutaminase-like putative cysteine protease
MRARVDRPELLKGRPLYWRGISLDHFDGRKWERSRPSAALVRFSGTSFQLEEARVSTGPLLRQEILLEPTGSPALFFLGRALSFTGNLRPLLRDSLGNLRAAYPPPFQISYEVLSDLDHAPDDDLPAESFLQVPKVDSRIRELSRQITEGIEGEAQKARALESHLKRNYRYSLEDLPLGSEDPLAVFLFQTGRGDCEYFSSALAIMLREVGIPARVVNGYYGGEWNTYGHYYLVEQGDAHSWVEAYLHGAGWVTLDSTPPSLLLSSRPFFAPVVDFVDFLRLRWYRYVVNFGLRDQYSLLAGLRRPYSWLNPALPKFTARESIKRLLAHPEKWIWLALAFLLCVAGASLFLLGNLKRRVAALPEPRSEAAIRYEHFLTLAQKRGLKKRRGETPDEFNRAAAKLGERLVGEFTALYQKARFGGAEPSMDEIKRMDKILSELRR